MRLKAKHLFPILSLIISTCCISPDTTNMLISFVTNDDRPTSVLAPKLCWTLTERKTLAKKLSAVGINMACSLQPNRPEFRLQNILILADIACPGTTEFLVKTSEEGYFRSPYRWLLVAEEGQDLNFLSRLDMPLNSDVVVATRRGREVHFFEVYKISKNSDVIYTTRSIWRTEGNFNNQTSIFDTEVQTNTTVIQNFNAAQVTVTVNKYGVLEDYRRKKELSFRRRDLMGHTLTLANVLYDNNETRFHLDDRLKLAEDSMTKMTYPVVKLCFEMLNATERLIFSHTWGYKDDDGNWQGVIDQIQKKEADLGTIMLFTRERSDIIEYVSMVGATSIQLVFREPPLAYVSNIFTLPFSRAVWLASFVCVLSCSILLYITCKWEATMPLDSSQLNGSWADVLILAIGAVLQQGCTLAPRFAAGRCVNFLLLLSLTILYAAYTANIVVLLRAPSSSINTLTDLLHSPLELGASDLPYNKYFFKKFNEPLRKAIYDKKIAPKGKKPHFYTMKEGIEKLRKGLFGFHMELNPGYRLIQETFLEEEKCDLKVIDYINEKDPWLPGQKRSPYRELFRVNFLKIREVGIQACIHRRLQVPKPKCSGPVSTFSSVGITDMYPAMLATLYGMLLAPAVLILEIVYKKLLIIKEKQMFRIKEIELRQ